MKQIYYFSLFFICLTLPYPIYAASSKKKQTACYQAYQARIYSQEAMMEHLDSIKVRNHSTPLAKTFASWLNNAQSHFTGDFVSQASVIRILGDINRQNRPAMISRLMKLVNNSRTQFLTKIAAIQALGYLLSPKHIKAIKALSKNLSDRASSIRRETALAIKNIGPRNMPKLEKKLTEMASNEKEELPVRIAAIEALGVIASNNYEMGGLPATIPLTGAVLYSRSNKMVLKIAEGLLNPNPEIRAATTATLKGIKIRDFTVIQQLKVQELYQNQWDTEKRTVHNHPTPFGSWFEVDIFLSIHRRGYFVVSDFEVSAGEDTSNPDWKSPYRIDFVIFGPNGIRLAVEYEGKKRYPTKETQENLKNLEDFGWEVFRISETDFKSSPEPILEELWNTLEEMNIHPLQSSPPSEFFWHYLYSRFIKTTGFPQGLE